MSKLKLIYVGVFLTTVQLVLYTSVFKKVLNYINLVMLEVTRIKVELF